MPGIVQAHGLDVKETRDMHCLWAEGFPGYGYCLPPGRRDQDAREPLLRAARAESALRAETSHEQVFNEHDGHPHPACHPEPTRAADCQPSMSGATVKNDGQAILKHSR